MDFAAMKRILLALLMAAAVLCAGGCDMFRSLAGRPTSKEIIAKAEQIRSEEAAHRARIDSLRRVEKQLVDSLAVMDSLKQIRGTILNQAKLGSLFTTRLESRYYIIVGAYRTRANAEKQLLKAQKDGYTATLISFRNGYNVVGVCPSNRLQETFENLKRVKTEPFCPPDVWILVNE